MVKRERENPCGVCGHYHKYEEGEVCGVCGHRMAVVAEKSTASVLHVSAFPSEILPEFLYLGSYDNAARAELLKTQGITCVLNTVPACQNLYRNSFTYYCLQYDQNLPFDDAIQFLEKCQRDNARVLVHCMTGKNRSPAIVIAYLMKSKGWKLEQSHQWVKERRPSVDINQAVYQQLEDYEQKIFGSTENTTAVIMPPLPAPTPSPLSFGYIQPNDVPLFRAPTFNSASSTSIFSRTSLDVPPQEFTFGAGQTEYSVAYISTFNPNATISSVDDDTMDGS